MANFSFNIVEHLATIAEKGNWALELNLVSWAGRAPSLDLRKWSEDHTKMSKGLTFTKDELEALRDTLNSLLS